MQTHTLIYTQIYTLIHALLSFLFSGAVGHQPDDPAGLRQQEEGLHHGGGRADVIGVRLPQQEGVSGERQQPRRAAEAAAGRRVGAAEPVTSEGPVLFD